MTGYTVHTGSNEKFRDGWENVFGGKKKASGKQKSSDKSKAVAQKVTAKKAKKPKKK